MTIPSMAQQAATPAPNLRRTVNPARQRTPMASVIGLDLRVGDRLGSADLWQIVELVDPVPGRCAADRVLAAAGGCPCYRAERPEEAPRRVAVGVDGSRRVVFDHVRYAIRVRSF